MSPRDEAAQARNEDLFDILSTGEPPAFATTQCHRITFWNRGAERVFGRPAREVLGAHCHEVVGGRDLYGNLFCYENCPLVATARHGEPLRQCELEVPVGEGEKRTLAITTIALAGSRPESFTLVHMVQSLASVERLRRMIPDLRFTAAGAPGVLGTNGHGTPKPYPAGEEAVASAQTQGVGDPPLTVREREVLSQVASGLQNKEIAQRLDISLATVRNHVHNVLDKLGVHSKLEAVCLAFRNGWVDTGNADGSV